MTVRSEVTGSAAGWSTVWQRDIAERRQCHRIQPVLRDDVAGEGLFFSVRESRRIVDRARERREVALPLRQGGDGEDGRAAERLPRFFPTHEEVGFIFDDRA